VIVRCIISGGQTGADRGALEAAHDLGLQRGGMAPAGWRAEDGQIPPWYRTGMFESGAASYRVRTRANVGWSTGTLILSFGPLTEESGSMLTSKYARAEGKPLLHIALQSTRPGPQREIRIGRVRDWMNAHAIRTLNVAGPRESREPGIQAAVRGFLVEVFGPPAVDCDGDTW
jgi:hypothetical protein